MYVCDSKEEFAEWLNETIERLEGWRATGLRSLESFTRPLESAQASAWRLGLSDILAVLGELPPAVGGVPEKMRDAMADIIIVRLSRAADWFDPSPPGSLSPNQKAVWLAVAEAGHRLTRTDILDRLERKGTPQGEDGIKHTLRFMVQAGFLTTRRDTTPPGYGLPQWD